MARLVSFDFSYLVPSYLTAPASGHHMAFDEEVFTGAIFNFLSDSTNDVSGIQSYWSKMRTFMNNMNETNGNF